MRRKKNSTRPPHKKTAEPLFVNILSWPPWCFSRDDPGKYLIKPVDGFGLAGTGQFFETKLGLPASAALLIGLVEFFGGLLLALGLATRIAAGFITGMMAVAVLKVHLANGFFWTGGGYEYPLLWGLLSLSYVIRGGGAKSLDALIGTEI